MTGRLTRLLAAAIIPWLVIGSADSAAKSADEIHRDSDHSLSLLREHALGIAELLALAKGVLVFPELVEIGFGSGGQFGEGALLVAGQPAAYYATAGTVYGLPPGALVKMEVVLFMTDSALAAFRNTLAWRVGVDATVLAVIPGLDAGPELAAELAPILSFSFSDQGLLRELSMEGSTIHRIAR